MRVTVYNLKGNKVKSSEVVDLNIANVLIVTKFNEDYYRVELCKGLDIFVNFDDYIRIVHTLSRWEIL